MFFPPLSHVLNVFPHTCSPDVCLYQLGNLGSSFTVYYTSLWVTFCTSPLRAWEDLSLVIGLETVRVLRQTGPSYLVTASGESIIVSSGNAGLVPPIGIGRPLSLAMRNPLPLGIRRALPLVWSLRLFLLGMGSLLPLVEKTDQIQEFSVLSFTRAFTHTSLFQLAGSCSFPIHALI
jgi:hypothetical protein